MPQGRSSTVIFGKVTLSSEIESMDSLIKHLGVVLKDYGYPLESGPMKQKDHELEHKEIEDAKKKLKDMMSDGGEDSESSI